MSSDNFFVLKKYKVIFSCLLIFLCFSISNRSPEVFADTFNYISYYQDVELAKLYGVEISFVLISSFLSSFSLNYIYLFFFYAFFSIYIKFSIFSKFDERFAILVIYATSSLLLHDFIQMRVGLAFSLLLASMYFLSIHKNFTSILFLIFSILFHYSVVVALPIYVLLPFMVARGRFFFLFFVMASLSLSYVLGLYFYSIVSFILSHLGFEKFTYYIELVDKDVLNVFSIRFIYLYLMLLFCFSYFSYFSVFYRVSLYLVVYGISIALFFRDNLVLSLRLSDFFITFYVFLLAWFWFNLRTNVLIGRFFPVLVVLVNIYYAFELILSVG